MQPTEVYLDPDHYENASPAEVLEAAARGHVGLDHRFLHAILDRPDKSIPALVRFARKPHGEDRIDLEEDLIAIFRHLRTPEALPYFIECIRREPHELSDELVETLYQLRGQAIEPLLKLFSELDEDDNAEVAFLLASLRVHDPRVLKILLDRLEVDAGDGAFSLGLYGDPAAKPALENLLAQLSDEDVGVRREIRYALDLIDAPTSEGASDIADQARAAEFDVWELYPEKSDPPIDILSEEERVRLLGNSSASLRAQAAASFFNKEISDKTRKQIYELAKTDSDASVRARCWEVLCDSISDPQIRKSLLRVVSNESAPLEERGGALVGLSQDAEDPAIRSWMNKLYANPKTRAKALEAMWRSLDRSFKDHFPNHLADEDLEIRRNAIWGVGYLGIYSEAARLIEFLQDDELRADALFAYALAVPCDISRARVRGLFKKIEELAGVLSPREEDLVQLALDERLALHGLEPVFFTDEPSRS